MKNTKKYAVSLVVIIMVLSGCLPASPSITQTVLPSISPSSTSEKSLSVVFTATRSPNITPPPTQYFPPLLTPRVTLFPTITDAEASEGLAHMLHTNGDCKLPCFWGIQPEITRYEELYSVIDNLGGYRFETLQPSGHLLIGSNFRFEDENRIDIKFQAELQDDIVRDMEIHLHNPKGTEIPPDDWFAYNMNEILRIYGVPSEVELFISSGGGVAFSFNILLNYENINTMILYSESTLGLDKYDTPTALIYCPEEIGTYTFQLHIGKHPFNTPPSGIPILQATGLNEQDFYKLFTENPSACLVLDRDAMP
jgi:hypothetical protein